MKPLLLIRADASIGIGTGHVMRCLALAQAWRRAGGEVLFALAETTPALVLRLQNEGIRTCQIAAARGSKNDAAQTVEIARVHETSWIVADGYCFDSAWQKQIRDGGFHLLVIDDYGHADHYFAEAILNQNVSAQESLYPRREPSSHLLMGPRFVLLREEFLKYTSFSRQIPDVAKRVLVTLGGSDPDNVSGRVVQALSTISEIEAVVVAGGSNPHLGSLQSAVAARGSWMRLVVDSSEMPELMAWADVAVIAGGGTMYEAAFMRLPAIVVVVAENQKAGASAMEGSGVCRLLGWYQTVTTEYISNSVASLLADPTERKKMSALGRGLVDGEGGSQVVALMESCVCA
jgi:UDP-2,4-diacetamido-2,4,6-trideoxy-beta-L-altropyranose hydrolase